MAYDKKKLIKQAVKLIESDSHVSFIEDVASGLGISRTTFYNLELDKVNTIRDALQKNRSDLTRLLRIKWAISDHPAAQEKLYRLLATDKQYERLVGSAYNIKGQLDTNLQVGTIQIVKASDKRTRDK